MRVIFSFLLYFCHSAFSAEVITKWTDEKGRVHYGDKWSVREAESENDIVIHDTFDEASYRAAVRRYEEYEKEQKLKEKKLREEAKREKQSGRKRPLTDAEKYDLYLEKKEEAKQKELQRKRQRRAEVRRKWKMGCNDRRYAHKKACR